MVAVCRRHGYRFDVRPLVRLSADGDCRAAGVKSVRWWRRPFWLAYFARFPDF
jgi:hypothetical protein